VKPIKSWQLPAFIGYVLLAFGGLGILNMAGLAVTSARPGFVGLTGVTALCTLWAGVLVLRQQPLRAWAVPVFAAFFALALAFQAPPY